MTFSDIFLSNSGLCSSNTTKQRSNLDNKESGNPIFLDVEISVIYCPYIGFAAAKTLHLAFKLT